MLLSYNELVILCEQGAITNVTPDQINGASIDITLGDTVLTENSEREVVSLKERTKIGMIEYKLTDCGFYTMVPGEFILAHTQQVFNLPYDISAEYKLKSSMARNGVNHATAGFIDAGFNNSVLTLELMNATKNKFIRLDVGIPIGQVVFFRHEPVPYRNSYANRGRYNRDMTVTQIKD